MRLRLQIPRVVCNFEITGAAVLLHWQWVALCFYTDIGIIWIHLVSIDSVLSPMYQGPSERGAGSPNFIRQWFQVQFGRAFAASNASESSEKMVKLRRRCMGKAGPAAANCCTVK